MFDHDDGLARARDLHARILVLDGHVDIPANFGSPGVEADADGAGAFDLVKARKGMVSGVCLVASASAATPDPVSLAVRRAEQEARYAAIANLAVAYPDRVGIARDPDGLRILRDQNRLAVIPAFQNPAALEPDLAALEPWVGRVATVALSFIGHNAWADSARAYPFVAGGRGNDGLSPLGTAAVARLNRAGVMVDVSQMSSAAVRDVMATTKAPVIASHSGARARLEAERNLSDGQMRGIANEGGLIQVAAFAPYLKRYPESVLAKIKGAWAAEGLQPPQTLADHLSVDDPATKAWAPDRFWRFLHELHAIFDLANPIADVADYVDTVEHVISVAGADHVGFGSDFNHGGGVVGWRNTGESLNLTAELLRRGHGPDLIEKLWGGNFVRTWTRVLDAATA